MIGLQENLLLVSESRSFQSLCLALDLIFFFFNDFTKKGGRRLHP